MVVRSSLDATVYKNTAGAINAVFIGTRHHLHASLVIAALERGKHVFVEKPLYVNEAELDQISEAYARSGRLLTVGFNRRFSPSPGIAPSCLRTALGRSLCFTG